MADIFSIISLANLASTASGGSGDILKDMFGDNPISNAKEKAGDVIQNVFGGPRQKDEVKMPGDEAKQNFGLELDFSMDFSKSKSAAADVMKELQGDDIVAQLLNGTFDLTKI